jgi:hypothetical protein
MTETETTRIENFDNQETDTSQDYISAINGEIIKKISLVKFFSPEIGTADLENWGTQKYFYIV